MTYSVTYTCLLHYQDEDETILSERRLNQMTQKPKQHCVLHHSPEQTLYSNNSTGWTGEPLAQGNTF